MKSKLESKAEGKKAEKASALVVSEVNEAAEEKKPLVMGGSRQQGIKSSFASGASEEIDNAIAELFYGEPVEDWGSTRGHVHGFQSMLIAKGRAGGGEGVRR